MPMYNLMKYIDNYSKTAKSLNQFFRDEPKISISDSKSYNLNQESSIILIMKVLKMQK